MPLLTRKRSILAKLESSYGTDASPTGAANAILVRNLDVTPLNAETVSRDLIRPYLGNSAILIAQSSVEISFEVELAGSGAAGTAPAWAPLLKACGFSESVTPATNVIYTPISDNIPSLSIYFQLDGVRQKIPGARGTVKFSVNVKQIPVMQFKFVGKYASPTDTAAPSVDFSAFQMPKIANTSNTTAFSLLGYSGYLESMELDLAGDLQFRQLVGYEQVLFVDRKPAGTFVIEAPLMASKNYFDAAKNGDVGTMSITHGTTAGNIVQIDCPKVNIQNPSYQDSQGVHMLSIPFVATPNVANDEIVVTLT